MPRLVILPGAVDDLTGILDYIGSNSPARAISFTDEQVQHCEKLAGLPGTYGRARPELADSLRSVVYKGYVILFRYAEGAFVVVNIIEGHRDIESLFS